MQFKPCWGHCQGFFSAFNALLQVCLMMPIPRLKSHPGPIVGNPYDWNFFQSPREKESRPFTPPLSPDPPCTGQGKSLIDRYAIKNNSSSFERRKGKGKIYTFRFKNSSVVPPLERGTGGVSPLQRLCILFGRDPLINGIHDTVGVFIDRMVIESQYMNAAFV